ncbi:MAG TPA: hypothetical protein VHK88_10785 [Aquihabitans sp.]|jgi:hypothetical protein|nr:hypothetical protein [Aquihabitans sp.]
MAQDQRGTMDSDHPTGNPTAVPSRRTVLRAGGLGLFGAAFLAACGNDEKIPGISGAVATTTLQPPTVPTTEPTEAALQEDVSQLSTAASVELLVAQVYDEHGGDLSTPELRQAATSFSDAHDAAARFIVSEGDVDEAASTPNEYLRTTLVDPTAPTLTDDTAILSFMAELESALAATYLNAAGLLTSAEWRQRAMSFGAASARRVGLLREPDLGGTPTEAFFPLVDLIPSEAYVAVVEEEG